MTEFSDDIPGYDDENIFAKILRGEIPCHKVYENDDFIAFMDVMPQAAGHTLVVPKAPSRNLLDADAEVLAKLMPFTQRIARAVRTAFSADGVTIMQFNEPAGGQTVFHLHVHVIPRHEGMPLKRHEGGMEKGEVLMANADKIRAALKTTPKS
ncbi:MAG: HIT family protein [Hyphomicrobiaceae bacterium]|nr:HIT family protein [Hyphomicrobiaceae bacterium]MCC0006977.1 HIT family protein [Hyphomicrobiaceae bacterium]